MNKLLLVIGVQKDFINENTKKLVSKIEKLIKYITDIFMLL